MSMWDVERGWAKNASKTNGYVSLRGETVLELIAIARKVEEEKKPKTVVEQIWEQNKENGRKIPWTDKANRIEMALAEAVEEMNHWQHSSTADGVLARSRLKSILAILKGEKTRDIPSEKA